MVKRRLIGAIIVRDGTVVQSTQFRHTNIIHSDAIYAVETFSQWSVDEIILLNVSRDSESRAEFRNLVDRVSEKSFVPLTVGGWIVNESYARDLLLSGADKLVLNTAFATSPQLVTALAERFGRQCIVASVDAQRDASCRLGVAVNRGRDFLPVSPGAWAANCVKYGAGEVLINSISHDGARRGYDVEALQSVVDSVSVPVIAFGGVMSWDHLAAGLDTGASGVAVANAFHYTEQASRHAKTYLAERGYDVRVDGRVFRSP